MIAADISAKAGDIYLGFVDRFSGSLIITGELSDVENAIREVCAYFSRALGFACCPVTKR